MKGKRANRRGVPPPLRPQDEFALRESRRRYRDSFDRLPFGIVLHAEDGRLLQANGTLARALGYLSADELLDAERPALEALGRPAEGGSEPLLLRRRNGSEIPIRLETREIRGPDGSVLYRETRVSDPGDSGLLEVRLPQAATARENDYRLVFEHVPLPMWVYDRETLAFLAVNESAVRAYGYSADEFRNMTILDIRRREEVPAFVQSLERAGDAEFHSVGQHRRKDGSVFTAEAFSRSLAFAGRPARLVLSCDVTRRLSSEELLRRSSEELSALSARLSALREEEREATDEGKVGEIVAGRFAGQAGAGPSGAPHERLSDREFRVFRALAAGRTLTAIARDLSVSVQTVSTYRSRIFEKMGLHCREDVVRYAARHGLIE